MKLTTDPDDLMALHVHAHVIVMDESDEDKALAAKVMGGGIYRSQKVIAIRRRVVRRLAETVAYIDRRDTGVRYIVFHKAGERPKYGTPASYPLLEVAMGIGQAAVWRYRQGETGRKLGKPATADRPAETAEEIGHG